MFKPVLWSLTPLLLTASFAGAATVTVRSGNGTTGGRDSSVTFLLGPSSGDFNHPFTATDFANAQSGPAAFIVSQHPAWVSGLSADPLAKWVGTNTNASSGGDTALYAVSFVIPDSFSGALLSLAWAADDTLGYVNPGLYLNGTAICASSIVGGPTNNFDRQHTLTCSVAPFLHVGTNWLYFDDVNAVVGPAGVLFSATITTTSVAVPYPQPTVTGLSPTSAPAGSGPLTLTINGSGFISSSSVTFNGYSRAVSLIGPGQLHVTLGTADLTTLGTFPVVVTNPSPGGGNSQPVTFTVQPPVTSQFSVPATAMPWVWSAVSGGLNYKYQYGINDGTSPVVVTSASGFSFVPGSTLVLTYLVGTMSIGPSSYAYTDANGVPFAPDNDNSGSTGKVLPSYYMDHSTYPIYSGELVGTFTDLSGAIVGTPFALGNGPTNLTVPSGATQLQFGVNDDAFSDNVGAWVISVTGTSPGPPALSVRSSLAFTCFSGSSPSPQSLPISGNTAIAFVASASSLGNWLTVNPTSGTTPATITVSVNAARS